MTSAERRRAARDATFRREDTAPYARERNHMSPRCRSGLSILSALALGIGGCSNDSATRAPSDSGAGSDAPGSMPDGSVSQTDDGAPGDIDGGSSSIWSSPTDG